MHLNLSTMDTLGTDESGQHCREVQTRVNVWTVCQKKGLCREVAIVQRFKQKSMYGLSAKKLAVVERWPLYRGSNKSKRMDCLPKNGGCGEVAISGCSTVHNNVNPVSSELLQERSSVLYQCSCVSFQKNDSASVSI